MHRIDFRDMFRFPNEVVGIHGNRHYFCTKIIENAINYAETLEALHSGVNPLERLGLQTLVKLYESNVGKITADEQE